MRLKHHQPIGVEQDIIDAAPNIESLKTMRLIAYRLPIAKNKKSFDTMDQNMINTTRPRMPNDNIN